jgi:phage terminase large subunit GpA-like protein
MHLTNLQITIRRKSLKKLLKQYLEAHRPPPNLTVSEWADIYRRLSRETSASPGRWRTSRVPYMRELMDALTDPFVVGIILKKSAQVAGTELLQNFIGYLAHLDPCPILLIEPKDEDVRKFSIKRLAPMIRDTPALRDIFVPAKSRDTGNTINYKKFLGGDITMVGVNSPSNLASLPIRVVLSDEDDRQTASSGDEGDPWALAWKRTTTFPNRKGVRVSTPTIQGSSRITAAFDATDKRYYHIPCPHCGALHIITREMLRWEKHPPGSPDAGAPVSGTARLVCPHCSAPYDTAQRDAAVADERALWVPTSTAKEKGWRGYFIWAAYSAFVTLDELVAEIHAAKSSGDPAKIQVMQNTVFGEPYDGVSEKIDDTKLAARAERYPAAVPLRVLILTAGLDVQDDRIEAELVGWAGGEESWSIDYRVFPGDPEIPEGQPGSPWDAVTAFLTARYRHESGFDFIIASACIDTGGHKTQSVYSYCQTHRARIHPVKGKGGWERDQIHGPTRLRFGKHKTRHVFLYILGVDKLKLQVVGRLQLERDPDDPDAPRPGYCHFPEGRPPEYYEQLTAERLVVNRRANRLVNEWKKEKSSDRNEALDCRVYAYAALLIRAPKFSVIAFKQKRRLAALAAASSGAAVPPDAETPPDAADTPADATDAPALPAQDPAPEIVHHARRHARRDPRRLTARERIAALRRI